MQINLVVSIASKCRLVAAAKIVQRTIRYQLTGERLVSQIGGSES
jgi:hypothetical protein